jgi:hypothetical protein
MTARSRTRNIHSTRALAAKVAALGALLLAVSRPASGALGLGSVQEVGPVPCPAGAPSGAQCVRIRVTGFGTDDLGAIAAVKAPAAPTGTVVLHRGGGTAFFPSLFADEYVARGLRVVLVAWESDWEQVGGGRPGGSIKEAACRPSTFVDWVWSRYHQGDRAKGFCAQGHSGGSGALGYVLAHYGLGAKLDYAMLSAGPVFGRLDLGCTAAPTDTTLVCPGFPNRYNYQRPGSAVRIDGWEHTSTCQNSPSPGDVVHWASDSVVSDGAVYDYPQTALSFWQCMGVNEAPGQGDFFADRVTSTVTRLECVPSTSTHCNGSEAPWAPCTTAGTCANPAPECVEFCTMVDQMMADCRPRHGGCG